MTLTFEEAQEALTDIADSIPAEIFRELNGGIILLPETKLHPESKAEDFFILGEYHFDPRGFGRYITIYYGSFVRAHGTLSRSGQIKKLGEVLRHELTHHLEHLAGDRSLEAKDAVDVAKYREGHEPRE